MVPSIFNYITRVRLVPICYVQKYPCDQAGTDCQVDPVERLFDSSDGLFALGLVRDVEAQVYSGYADGYYEEKYDQL